MAFSNLSFEYSAGIGATTLSGSPEPWAIPTGAQLVVSIGGTSEVLVFMAGDGDSAAILASTISFQSTLIDASDEGGYLRLTSRAPGSQAELIVLGGTANAFLVFDSEVHYGVTYYGAPWAWSTVVNYTGKAVREEFTDDVDPTRELFGTAWFPASALEYEQVLFTDNGLESLYEKFRVYEVGWGSALNHDLSGVAVDFTQNDSDVSANTEQFQAYEEDWLLTLSDGVYSVETEPEPDEAVSEGSFEVQAFANSTSDVENFAYVLAGERFKNPEIGGDNTLQIGPEMYDIADEDVPDGLSEMDEIAVRTKLLAAKVNRKSEYFWAVPHKHPIFPEIGLFLYPIVPLSTIYELEAVELDGGAFTDPLSAFGFNRTAWHWEDFFPPTTTFALP